MCITEISEQGKLWDWLNKNGARLTLHTHAFFLSVDRADRCSPGVSRDPLVGKMRNPFLHSWVTGRHHEWSKHAKINNALHRALWNKLPVPQRPGWLAGWLAGATSQRGPHSSMKGSCLGIPSSRLVNHAIKQIITPFIGSVCR